MSGFVEHPAPNIEPGDVVVLRDGREALVAATLGVGGGSQLAALLEGMVGPVKEGSE